MTMSCTEPKAEEKEANATIDAIPSAEDTADASEGGASLEHTLTDSEVGSSAGCKPSHSTPQTFWVQFEDGDLSNPFNWSNKRKWIITCCEFVRRISKTSLKVVECAAYLRWTSHADCMKRLVDYGARSGGWLRLRYWH
jgi:hypothetical protein